MDLDRHRVWLVAGITFVVLIILFLGFSSQIKETFFGKAIIAPPPTGPCESFGQIGCDSDGTGLVCHTVNLGEICLPESAGGEKTCTTPPPLPLCLPTGCSKPFDSFIKEIYLPLMASQFNCHFDADCVSNGICLTGFLEQSSDHPGYCWNEKDKSDFLAYCKNAPFYCFAKQILANQFCQLNEGLCLQDIECEKGLVCAAKNENPSGSALFCIKEGTPTCPEPVDCNNPACLDDIACQSKICVPNCGNKNCGDDGCGGSCGICAADESCQNGGCVVPTVTVYGDVDDNKVVDIFDALAIVESINAGTTDYLPATADADCDGKIDIFDALAIVESINAGTVLNCHVI